MDENTKARKELILSYLELIHANFIEKNQTLTVTLPRDTHKIFGKPIIEACFSKEDSEKNGYELIHPGNNFLDKVYQECSRQGAVSFYHLKNELVIPFKEMIKILKFRNCTMEYEETFPLEKYAYGYLFQVQYSEPDIPLQLIWLALDAETFEYIEWLISTLPATDIQIVNRYPKLLNKERAYRAYQVAITRLKKNLASEIQKIELENNLHLKKEFEKISRYYEKLREEERNRIEELKLQLDEVEEKLKRHKTLDTFKKYQDEKRDLSKKINQERHDLIYYFDKISKFEAKEKEREKKKHELVCEINLLSLCFIGYTAFKHRLLVFNEDSQKILDVYSISPTSNLRLPTCTICKKKIDSAYLCAQSHIICENCKIICVSCGKTFCTSCIKKHRITCFRR